ncbi:MAG: UDP-2,3-diacylglucosamine diphosphatase [Flavobacteriales bacterium]|nr:UDP-2,3-diacylglucosamine hydrolase [Flavobacteriales bacterium]MDG1916955.1 UDP-2,3-diacylglucosamine diphosphatase [Flavobacteriales bacterium]
MSKIYFASDLHLGVPNKEKSLERERLFVQWLNEIKADAEAIFLVGDIFDFWFEYKKAVPKGYVRLLGKLAEISDSGIPIHIFTGNHDMWLFDYLEEEINATIYREPIEVSLKGKRFFIGHGDGLGPGDKGYKIIKKIFENKICQWLFERIHPNLGISIAEYWSKKSRIANGQKDETYHGEKEWLTQFCKEKKKTIEVDYFVFGHRHLPLEEDLGDNTSYINLGEWVNYNSYAVFDGEKLELKRY